MSAERASSAEYEEIRHIPSQGGTVHATAVADLEAREDPATAAELGRGRSLYENSPEWKAAIDERSDRQRADASGILSGDQFVFGQANEPVALWGRGGDIVWARGESLIVAGGIGSGKTTLLAQLTAARLGVTTEVLGLPVKPSERRVLYLASDRPAQIARLFRRIFTPDDQLLLKDRLRVYKGPPAKSLALDPEWLLRAAWTAGADTVVLDSLKDMGGALTDEQTGLALNRAMQLCLANDIDVVASHHNRKLSGDSSRKISSLDDVYGSTWLVSGAGSVIALNGDPGSVEVELRHLKQPENDVGPLRIEHDHDHGVSRVVAAWDPLQWLKNRGDKGGTSSQAARAMTASESPSKTEVQKARKRLDALVDAGKARKEAGAAGGAGGTTGATWWAT